MANQILHVTNVEFCMKEKGSDEVSEMIMDKLIDYAYQLYKEAGKPIEEMELIFETDYATWSDEEQQAEDIRQQKLQDFYNTPITVKDEV
tara:strand:+ start:1276 stop:1545 length:270 start_codon:yes stop_codon:yes gene_type:complete